MKRKTVRILSLILVTVVALLFVSVHLLNYYQIRDAGSSAYKQRNIIINYSHSSAVPDAYMYSCRPDKSTMDSRLCQEPRKHGSAVRCSPSSAVRFHLASHADYCSLSVLELPAQHTPAECQKWLLQALQTTPEEFSIFSPTDNAKVSVRRIVGDMLAGLDREIFVNVRPGQMEIFSRESQQLTIITDTGWQILASLRDANLPHLPIDASDCPSQRSNRALNVQRVSTEFE
jgi:hypothetical protein